jgi:hypothetical protein
MMVAFASGIPADGLDFFRHTHHVFHTGFNIVWHMDLECVGHDFYANKKTGHRD